MILLFAIVQNDDADLLVSRLVAHQHRVTRINSAGGFLAGGNATILMGITPEEFDDIIATIRATCHSRTRYVNAMPWGPEAMPMAAAIVAPLEVQVGGAAIFGLPIKRFLRLRGGAESPATDVTFELPPSEGRNASQALSWKGASPMNLVIAVIQNEDADQVVRALLAAGHRLTRINTAGGFLRRGNATLFIGVESGKLDDVLQIIQANVRPRTEATPPSAGIPMYGATVFVLETVTSLHI